MRHNIGNKPESNYRTLGSDRIIIEVSKEKKKSYIAKYTGTVAHI